MFRDYDECGNSTGGYMDIIPTLIMGMIMLIVFITIFMPLFNTINPINTSQVKQVNDNNHLFDVFKNVDYGFLTNIIVLAVSAFIIYYIFKHIIIYHPFRSVRRSRREAEKEKPKKKKAPMFVDIDMHDLKAEEINDSIFNKDNEQESEPHWKVFKKR